MNVGGLDSCLGSGLACVPGAPASLAHGGCSAETLEGQIAPFRAQHSRPGSFSPGGTREA